MFGTRGLVELGKSILKLVVVGTIAAFITRSMMGDMLSLGSLPAEVGIGRAASLTVRALLFTSCGLLLIAGMAVRMLVMPI